MSQFPFPVSQFDGREPNFAIESADEILRYYESELRKEPHHLGRKDANTATVVARIRNKLRRAHSAIDRFNTGIVSQQSTQRFCDYLVETIQPILEEQGSPYEGLDDLMASLRHKTQTDREAVIV